MCDRLDLRFPVALRPVVGPCDPSTDEADGTQPIPAQRVPIVLIDEDDRRYATCARWGWRGAANGLHTHARIENAPTHPLWRSACATRRCVVPVVGWWDGAWHISADPLAMEQIFYLAALWHRGDDGMSVAILTQPAQAPWTHAVPRIPIALDLELAGGWATGLPTSKARSRQRADLVWQATSVDHAV